MRKISQGIIEWWEFYGLTRGTVDFGLLLQTGESVGLEFRSCPYCQSQRSCSLMLAMLKQLVKWTSPALRTEKWEGFAYALQGFYNKENALKKIRKLKGFDDGNALTNLLWWIHSRGEGK